MRDDLELDYINIYCDGDTVLSAIIGSEHYSKINEALKGLKVDLDVYPKKLIEIELGDVCVLSAYIGSEQYSALSEVLNKLKVEIDNEMLGR